MTLPEIAQFTAEQFRRAYGAAPRWMAAAPGRVNVIGEHTDYNDGFVLPMAIERYTVVAAGPRPAGQANTELRSVETKDPVVLDLAQPLRPLPKGHWGNYPAGVLAGWQARGVKLPPFAAMAHSTVPIGGGLSSSAALEVATATVCEAMTGQSMDPTEKALLCQEAEHKFAGVPCGIMDQFISTMGRKDHLLLLDCRSRRPELVPMSDPAVSLLIVNTNVKHALTGGEYSQRRAQCEQAARDLGLPSLRDATWDALEKGRGRMDDTVFRRARHIVGEIERTTQAAQEIRQARWPEAGKLMYASHQSLRDDFEVSCAELDAVVEIACGIGLSGGVYGCRMTGGGFGGCAVALVKTSEIGHISRKIEAQYREKTRISAALFVSRPAGGAVQLPL
jgi:galactokinase